MIAESLRPLLACTLEKPELLRLPAIASAKLDGIRCVITNGLPMSRNGKIIPNRYIQSKLSDPKYEGLDGELIVGPPSGASVFNRTTSGVMSQDGEPDFTYWVFDNHLFPAAPFESRVASLRQFTLPDYITILPHILITSLDQLARYEAMVLEQGFEGVMVRRPDGPYKNGRSTLNEGILLRIKRFKDSEAKIVGLEEGVANLNEATKDALGYTERSTHQANMRKANRVGTIIGEDLHTGQTIRISPGRMTQEQRARHWVFQSGCLTRVCKYRFFDYGVIDQPRFATFQAFLDGQP